MPPAPPSGFIELRNKNLVCVISPELGGAVTKLEIEKKGVKYQVLHATEEEALTAKDPRRISLVHLAPYGGPMRAGGNFKWDSRPFSVAPNFPDEKLFRNGIAWQRAWMGKKDGRHSATLKFTHKKQPGWPFDFSLIAVFDLEEDNLSITYEMANEGRTGTMPLGIGCEMRLPRMKGTLLTAGISNMWQQDADGVPTLPGEVTYDLDLKQGIVIDNLDAQRWFSGWTGRAAVDYPESKLSTSIKTTDFGFLGFSIKPKNPYFRLAALSHIPGMLDIKGQDPDDMGFRWLGAGESYTARVKIDVDLSLY